MAVNVAHISRKRLLGFVGYSMEFAARLRNLDVCHRLLGWCSSKRHALVGMKSNSPGARLVEVHDTASGHKPQYPRNDVPEIIGELLICLL